jgi:hypothetical protein
VWQQAGNAHDVEFVDHHLKGRHGGDQAGGPGYRPVDLSDAVDQDAGPLPLVSPG